MNLKTLLGVPEFHLRLLTNDADTERAISWIYSSDLSDPTPFLSEGQMLLTTGRQFAQGGLAEQYLDYVKALAAIGIVGLGFGTGLGTQCVPEALIEACEEYAIPLFEVPYATPFIALIRWLSDLQVERLRQRDSWVIDAQRAVALAALKADGLQSALRVLGAKLGVSVLLFNRDSEMVYVSGKASSPLTKELAAQVRAALEEKKPMNKSIRIAEVPITLHTLGRAEGLLGVIVLLGEPAVSAREARLVTITAIALAELSLTHNRSIAQAQETLRSELIRILLRGFPGTVSRVAAALGTPLSPDPLAVARIPLPLGSTGSDRVLLNRYAHADGTKPFSAEYDGSIVALIPKRDLTGFIAFCHEHRLPAGISDIVDYGDFEKAFFQAELAMQQSGADRQVVLYDPTLHLESAALVDRQLLTRLALQKFQRVLASNDADSLIESLKVWLEANGSWDRAAAVLGVHRHTLRGKIQKLEALLDMDLTVFDQRTVAWLFVNHLDR